MAGLPQPTLRDLVRIDMSPRQSKAIERIDAEDLDLVVYMVKKHYHEIGRPIGDDSYYDAGCFALKQYYSTTIFDPLNMHAVTHELDPFWHSHILDTARYELLCRDIDAFMHHDPLNQLQKDKVAAIEQVYSYTWDVLEKIFGSDYLDERFFPSSPEPGAEVLVCRHDVDRYSFRKYEDVMPVNREISELREKYGHDTKSRLIREGVEERLTGE